MAWLRSASFAINPSLHNFRLLPYCSSLRFPFPISRTGDLLAYLCHAHMEANDIGFIGIDDFDAYCPMVCAAW